MPAAGSSAVARRRHRRTEEIIAAAWTLAERDGIASLSLRDLAAAVGMRAPSLYEYFDGKDAIHDAMFAEGWTALRRHMEGRTAPTDDPTAALIAGTEAFLDFCAASLPRYQLMFTRAVPGWEPGESAYAVSQSYYATFVADLAAVGVVDPADVDLFAAIGAGLAAQQAANDPGGDRYRRLVPAAIAMFVHHLEEGQEQ